MSARTLLITGGAGFIGSHVVRLFIGSHPEYRIVNLDALTYAGNLENLSDIESASNHVFVHADITDEKAIDRVFSEHAVDAVIHLAAESHVDRSILDPLSFIRTNVMGTAVLLNTARRYWKDRQDVLFYHVSTDEVYGSLGDTGLFTEETPYDPRSPYSASKASSDHLVKAYHHTYRLPVVISNCSNNYGSHQFPEKLIPLMINNIVHRKPLPVYGEGLNVRDWLWVEDHARAIEVVFHQGRNGETYNIGGFNEWRNIDLVHLLCRIMDEKLGRAEGDSASLITFVKDRAGHDQRYAIDASKIHRELGWSPTLQFEEGLRRTVDWYLQNPTWVEHITSGSYLEYYQRQYSNR
ncbi:MAG: dTDP-glucose 4,6-dehydratase [Chitinophagia bacterium]|nr:dTDP-glucose 4,6-dehydratase [Chitinophagia bacterium]